MNYLRDWELVLTPYTVDESYNVIPDTERSRTVTGLKVMFNIRKTFLGDPLLGNFQVYNIGPQTEALLTSGACLVSFSAGWVGRPLTLIFSGQITNSFRLRQSTDMVWNIWARDSGIALNRILLAKGFTADTPAKDIVTSIVDIADDLTSVRFTGSSESVLSNAIFTEGYTMVGSVRDELDELLLSLNMHWMVDSGVLIIVRDSDGSYRGSADTPPYPVSVKSGLLTIPNVDWVGVQFDHVLDGKLTPGNFINLEPQTVQEDFGNKFYVPADKRKDARIEGVFKIMETTFKGDTRGSKWLCSVKAFSEYGVVSG